MCDRTRATEDTARRLFVPIGDAASVEVVRRELDLHPVAGQDADVVAAHLAGNVTEHVMPVVEFDPEHRIREGLGDLALHLDLLLFGHALRRVSDAVEGGRRYRPSNVALPGPSSRKER